MFIDILQCITGTLNLVTYICIANSVKGYTMLEKYALILKHDLPSIYGQLPSSNKNITL